MSPNGDVSPALGSLLNSLSNPAIAQDSGLIRAWLPSDGLDDVWREFVRNIFVRLPQAVALRGAMLDNLRRKLN